MPQTFASKLHAHLTHMFQASAREGGDPLGAHRCAVHADLFNAALRGPDALEDRAQLLLNSLGPTLEKAEDLPKGLKAQQRNETRRMAAAALNFRFNA
jgi:hypothetical protein